jgi:hypothetical protein
MVRFNLGRLFAINTFLSYFKKNRIKINPIFKRNQSFFFNVGWCSSGSEVYIQDTFKHSVRVHKVEDIKIVFSETPYRFDIKFYGADFYLAWHCAFLLLGNTAGWEDGCLQFRDIRLTGDTLTADDCVLDKFKSDIISLILNTPYDAFCITYYYPQDENAAPMFSSHRQQII